MSTYTLAWGFFFEKSQAKPRSEMRTWPCSSKRMLAGLLGKEEKKMIQLTITYLKENVSIQDNNTKAKNHLQIYIFFCFTGKEKYNQILPHCLLNPLLSYIIITH